MIWALFSGAKASLGYLYGARKNGPRYPPPVLVRCRGLASSSVLAIEKPRLRPDKRHLGVAREALDLGGQRVVGKVGGGAAGVNKLCRPGFYDDIILRRAQVLGDG